MNLPLIMKPFDRKHLLSLIFVVAFTFAIKKNTSIALALPVSTLSIGHCKFEKSFLKQSLLMGTMRLDFLPILQQD